MYYVIGRAGRRRGRTSLAVVVAEERKQRRKRRRGSRGEEAEEEEGRKEGDRGKSYNLHTDGGEKKQITLLSENPTVSKVTNIYEEHN